MKAGSSWFRRLVVLGGVVFALGTLDPMEGSIVILVGVGLILLGTYGGRQRKAMLVYWKWVAGLVAAGVAALWGLTDLGGVGGKTGRSMWWLLLCVPYPVGWLLALGGIIVRVMRWLRGNPSQAGTARA
jgi:hypothetical protein